MFAAPPGQPEIFRYQSEIERSAQMSGVSAAQVTEFFRMLQANQGPLKTALSVVKTADNAIKFAKFCFQLQAWGFAVSDTVQVLALAGSLRSAHFLGFMDGLLKNSARLSSVFAKTKGTRNGLGYMLLIINVYTNLADGDYSQAIAKTYKFVMGKMIPWAGAIDTLQSFFPNPTPRSTLFFKLLRACDPIGLGAAGVDAFVIMVQSIFGAVQGQTFDEDRLNKLANRLKTGPTAIFYEMGDAIPIGEIVYDVTHMSAAEWRELGHKSMDQLHATLRNWVR